jgi:hypothetical protein
MFPAKLSFMQFSGQQNLMQFLTLLVSSFFVYKILQKFFFTSNLSY